MILITAPTSTNGRELVRQLLDRDAELRLLVRDASRLDPEVRERTEVLEGSHGEAAAIDRASEGVEAVFWLTPHLADVERLEDSFAGFARPAREAFAKHCVERIVGISALGRGTPQAAHAGPVTASLGMDDEFAATGIPYRAVTCPSFMHNLLNQVGAIREKGMFFMMAQPDLKAPAVASRDIAATAARLLLGESWDGSGEVPVLGPEDLSPNEMAAIMSGALGTEIGYQQISGLAMKERLAGFGFSAVMAQAMVDMFEAKNQGLDNAEPRTAESATPTTFREWCERTLQPALAG